MSPQINTNDYSEIRQIIMDAIEPLKDQLDRIYTSLKDEYARKDVVEPQLKGLRSAIDDLENRMVTAPQKALMYAGSIAALIWTLFNILSHLK